MAQVVMKLVVDNMATQCVEDMLMRVIPDLFSPTVVMEMDISMVHLIAQESDENSLHREKLLEMAKVLEAGQETCRRHVSSQKTG